MSLAETNTPRAQLLEQMIAQAQEKETKARKAEAIAWAELRGHTEELHRQQEVILEPLQTKYQSAYADRVTRMQRTRAVEHAASLSAAEASALRDLPQAPIEQLVALREKRVGADRGPSGIDRATRDPARARAGAVCPNPPREPRGGRAGRDSRNSGG